jgi:hypothetical protein
MRGPAGAGARPLTGRPQWGQYTSPVVTAAPQPRQAMGINGGGIGGIAGGGWPVLDRHGASGQPYEQHPSFSDQHSL